MGIFDKISGKAIEDKIGEYSEVYGEVLLGLHQEVEQQNIQSEKREQQLNSELKNLQHRIELLEGQVNKLKLNGEYNQPTTQTKQIQLISILCIFLYAAVIGLGLTIWLTQ